MVQQWYMALSKKRKEKIAHRTERATKWIGSTQSLVVHTIVFLCAFLLPVFGVDLDTVLLVLTTALSLEAIYLAIFIQMSMNKASKDIEDIQEDVEDIQEEIEDIGEDVEEIQKDVDEIQEDIDEIQEDVDEIQEDIEEIEEDSTEDQKIEQKEARAIESIQKILSELQKEIEQLKK